MFPYNKRNSLIPLLQLWMLMKENSKKEFKKNEKKLKKICSITIVKV